MCGIAGILSLSPDAAVELEPLRQMAAQLVHRGPDDEGYYLDPQRRCGFGFRRLSIIDLVTGQQPIANEDRTVWAVFNGEIYNFRELRAELQAAGHRFATSGDSEVIVHLYEEHGEDCFGRLAGMFAIAIWDERRGELLLARDRLGKKPLNYAVAGKRLYFASEAKAILALSEVPRELDAQSLHRYLLFQYVPAPHSIYKGFAKLTPGSFLRLTAHQPADAGPQTFWRVPQPAVHFKRGSRRDYQQAKMQLGELLTRAVQKRLVADVPLGAFLSGGIDSSIVVALMRRLGVQPLRTFSIGFADARYDETAYAREVARKFQTEHQEHLVTPQAREVLDRLAWHYDEPFADSSAIPTYYLSRWTRASVTVALTGDGGDECFGGYERYRAAELAASLDFLPRGFRGLISAAAGALPHGRPKSAPRRAYRFLSTLGQPAARRYLSWVGVFAPEMLATGYRPEFAERINLDEPLRWLEHLCEGTGAGPADRAAYTDFHSYLPYDLLTKVDIASMACGLECRCPFLDHDVVEFALTLPTSWRVRAGGKRILRDWAANLLPAQIIRRSKMGFGVPIGEWFRGELGDLLEEQVLSPGSLSTMLFRPDWLRSLIAAHLSGRANHEHRLWALLMLELWRRRWLPAAA